MFGWILRAFAVGLLFLGFHGVQALLGGHAPSWGSLAAAVTTYVVMGFAVKALFFRVITAPFKAKGAPLRGARLVVHSVTAGGAREEACDDGADDCDEEHPALRLRGDLSVAPYRSPPTASSHRRRSGARQ